MFHGLVQPEDAEQTLNGSKLKVIGLLTGKRSSHLRSKADEVDEPLRMDQLPTLVFSEVMRDVDLFVGVGSIGNDPGWQDGGRETRYGQYWQINSFGELSGTALSRIEKTLYQSLQI